MKKRTVRKTWLVFAALFLGLLFFLKPETVKADSPVYYVYLEGYYLGEGNGADGLYYVQSTHTVTTDSSVSWNARYVPSSGTLYLRNYSGGRIVCLPAHGDKPFKISLQGTNVINSSDSVGIKVSAGSVELDITSTSGYPSLEIHVVDTDANYAVGIDNYYNGSSTETVFIDDKAAVSVGVYGKRSFGIRAGGTVNILESASANVSVTYTKDAGGYSAAVYTKTGNLDISTSGAVNLSAVSRDEYKNQSYGYAFYSGKSSATLNCSPKNFPYVSLSSVGYKAKVSNISGILTKDYYNLLETVKTTGVTEALLLEYSHSAVPITGATFPDQSFRLFVSASFDTDHDGFLSASEIDQIKEIYVTNEDSYKRYNDAYSLVGIEYFTKLTDLTWDMDIFDEGITPGNILELDLRSNTKLKNVTVRSGQLRELYVKGLKQLKWLDCANNHLHGPTLDNLTALNDLLLHGNLLTDLYISGTTNLDYLDISDNLLDSVDVSKNTELRYLYCGGNPFTSLSLAKNTKLESLSCQNSQLTTLNVSKCTALKTLDCSDSSSLKTLTLGTNSVLDALRCIRNSKLTSVNISSCSKLKQTVGNKKGFVEDGKTYIQYAVYDEYDNPEICIQADLGLVLFYKMPKNVNTCAGKTASFSVKASGNGKLTYQWQYQKPGETSWNYVSAENGKKASYSLTTKPRHDGYKYRCKVTNLYGTSVYSSAVTLRVLGITTQPSPVSTAVGKTAVFTVEATGADLQYQWYYKKPGETIWTVVTAASGKTASYSLTVKERHDGYQYFCRVTNAAGTVDSKAVKLTVVVTPTISSQPKSVSVIAGNPATFTVAASGGGLSYQWYYKKPGETTWQKVTAESGKTASYTLTVKERHNGYKYYCEITNAAGTVSSNTVKLTVK